tara:strand:+ start:878 stop:1336 length:459 start_codon:yes stop_codon:yes gene_type:complete
MSKIVQKFIRIFRKFLFWLWHQDGTSAERARGLAFGVFSGCFPFFGFQIFLGISLAVLFRGNRVLAALGTWISNPITYLPLYLFNFNVGCFFLGNLPENTVVNQITFDVFWDNGLSFVLRILLGSTIVGFLSALAIGFIIYMLSKANLINYS